MLLAATSLPPPDAAPAWGDVAFLWTVRQLRLLRFGQIPFLKDHRGALPKGRRYSPNAYKATERCLKLLHRIPDHRPTEQAGRDQRLEDLRKEFPDASWGQLANKYNGRFAKEDEANQIDAKIAERALNRLARRRSKQERELVLRALNAAGSSLHTASLTKEEEILPLLPTPEIIFQLLISDK